MSDAERIETAALAWRLRRDEPGWSATDETAFTAWLDAATAHRVAWLRIQHGWQRTERLAALSSPARPPQIGDALGRRRPAAAPVRRPRWRPMRSAAAALFCMFAVGALLTQSGRPLDRGVHVTAVGARVTVPLADGSRLELNTDTRLRAQIGEDERVAWLDRGEAYFDVMPDPDRPFVVHAGGRRIVVLGTRFAVRRDAGRVEVVVEDGRVRIEAPGGPPAIVVGGGIAITEAGATLVADEPRRVENQLAWRQGLLVFERATLAEAAGEFNRYNGRKLQIRDAEIAGMRISGSFEATNLDAFVRLLRRAYGLRIDEVGDRVAISG